MKIEWKKTNSHIIYAVAYSLEEQALYLKFNNLKVWKYTPFTFEEYKQFLGSNSLGSYFHKNIKNKKESKEIIEDGM